MPQECIAADSKLLLQHQIMDYSLLVGIIEGKAPAVGIGSKTFVVQHTKGYTTYHIAIIDFLQVWNIKKQVARGLKFYVESKSTEPPPVYQARFVQYFSEKFVANDCLEATAESNEVPILDTNWIPVVPIVGETGESTKEHMHDALET